MTPDRPPRALIFIVAYHAETTILDVLHRLPALPGCSAEVLIIDDGSTDGTFALADNGATVKFKYKQDGATKTFTTEIANVKLGKARLEGGLNLATSGGSKGIYGFLGVRF